MRTAELDRTAQAPVSAHEQATPWRRLNGPLHAAFVVTFVVFVALFFDTFVSLVQTWSNAGTYQYAFFIFPICLVLVWLRRARLRRLTGLPRLRGLVPAAALCALWLAGAFADINVVRHFCVVALMPVLVYLFYGAAVTRALIFPLCYVFFAVPLGNFMVGPLQDITARLSVFALQLTDVPVFMSGRVILTPASAWHVAEACSGVKFFIATTAFGVLYANLFYQSLSRRVIFVVCAMVVPVVANGLRVFFTILTGEYFGLEYATGTDHLIFGWQFFGTVLLLLFLAGWPWHEPEPPATADSSAGAVAGRRNTPSPAGALSLGVVSVVVLALAPGWLAMARATPAPPVVAATSTPPASLGELPRAQPPASMPKADAVFANADARTVAYYNAPVGVLRVDYALYSGAPSAGHELITTGNRLFDPTVWQVVSRGPAKRPDRAFVFTELALSQREGRGQQLIWYGYRVNDRLTTSPLEVKLLQAWYALTLQPVESAVIALSVADSDLEDARQRLAVAAPAVLRFFMHDRSDRP